jgi:hypothetical protein
VPRYEALSPTEIAKLATRLSELSPSGATTETRLNTGAWNGLAKGFIAPTNEQLEEYGLKYGKWLSQSEDALRKGAGVVGRQTPSDKKAILKDE